MDVILRRTLIIGVYRTDELVEGMEAEWEGHEHGDRKTIGSYA